MFFTTLRASEETNADNAMFAILKSPAAARRPRRRNVYCRDVTQQQRWLRRGARRAAMRRHASCLMRRATIFRTSIPIATRAHARAGNRQTSRAIQMAAASAPEFRRQRLTSSALPLFSLTHASARCRAARPPNVYATLSLIN